MQPFLYIGPSKVATQWFGDGQRTIATAIGFLSVDFGGILSFITAPMFVTQSSDLTKGRAEIKAYMLFGAIFVTVLSSFILLIYH